MEVNVERIFDEGGRVGTGLSPSGFLGGATGAGGGLSNGCASIVKASNPLAVKNIALFIVG